MFFDDEIAALAKRKRAVLRDPPPIPATGWKAPTAFPNLASAAVLSLDVETREDDWDHGPGWARGPRGHIVGFSVGARDKIGNIGSWYFPLRHEVCPEQNLDPTLPLAWLKAQLETPHIPKIGANLVYDIGWLGEEGINVQGELYDVQFAEALIDETARVALDNLAIKYVGTGKETNLLYHWLASAYGGAASSDQRSNIYRAPPSLVGPYGEADASLPIRIFDQQASILDRQYMRDLFRMECSLIPLLVRMRRHGVRVDLARCQELHGEISRDIGTLEDRLYELVGIRANVNSPRELAPIFDAAGIEYPFTVKGAPSFQKEFLKGLNHPVAELVNEIREHYKIRGTFLQSYILDGHVNGRIHCNFHSLKGDENGTVTGRFASSEPNLQNIPIRTSLGKKIRSAFLAESGHLYWRKIDYSQIEYRMLAHFASGRSPIEIEAVKRLVESYVNNPKTDYHDVVYDNVGPLLGYDLTDKALRTDKRRPIKNINFGLIYGQSQDSLAYKAGLGKAEANIFFKAYHEGAPYVRSTMKAIADEVQMNGFITTIGNRRCHFNLWEPSSYGTRGTPLPQELAILNYGPRIKRAYEYKGVNYKLQGSAADVIKKAMSVAEQSGVFAATGDPLLQVHDELGFSQVDDGPAQREAFAYLENIMEHSTLARVPITVDAKTGANWGVIE